MNDDDYTVRPPLRIAPSGTADAERQARIVARAGNTHPLGRYLAAVTENA